MKKLLVFASICAMLVSTTACGNRIYLNGKGPEGGKSTKYTAGDARISDEITDIKIDWALGSVDIVTSSDEVIDIHEECKEELEDREKVQWWVDGSCLRIQYSESNIGFNGMKEKNLTLTVPEDIDLNSLTIDSASGDITQAPIHTKTLSVDNATGNYTGEIKGLCEKVELDSASGNLNCTLEQLGTLKADNATGQIVVKVDSAESFEINTASGDVSLYLDEGLGFTLDVDTASGNVDSSLAMNIQNKKYVHGDGSCKIYVDTASGDVHIEGK